MHTYINACMHAYIHTYRHTYIHTGRLADRHPYKAHTDIHTYIHTGRQPDQQTSWRGDWNTKQYPDKHINTNAQSHNHSSKHT